MASMAGMTIGLSLLGAGAVAVAAGIVAAGRLEPAQVAWGEHVFVVQRRDEGSAETIELVRPDGSIAAAFAGSTDLVCDGPRLFLIDVDADDEIEVFFTTCDEPGFVDHRGRGQLEVVELSEQQTAELAPLHSFWFHEVRGGGLTLICGGIAIALAGAVALVRTLLRGRGAPRVGAS
jgi:hypothetical protein